MISRRQWLQTLGSAFSAVALAPERLLAAPWGSARLGRAVRYVSAARVGLCVDQGRANHYAYSVLVRPEEAFQGKVVYRAF